ncbi:MAG: hypothetical protein NTZ78_02350 [Candidatus Aureabacteria bacterium]|nr:hypothetical protein [Candidatus Auribacterota bacterium]
MRATLVVIISVMCAAGLCGVAVAGSTDSPGAPSAGSGMYSLSQIYDYLNSGVEATPVSVFQEPGGSPASTMKSTKQIYDDIKAQFIQCPTTAAHVESGWAFFCTQSGSWGVQTGTLVVLPTPTPSPTSTPMPVTDSTGWSFSNPGGNAGKLGVKIHTNKALSLIKVVKDSAWEATYCYVYETNGTLKASVSFSGNEAVFSPSVGLANNTDYYIEGDKQGSSYNLSYAGSSLVYPFNRTNVNFTKAAINEQDSADTRGYLVASIISN